MPERPPNAAPLLPDFVIDREDRRKRPDGSIRATIQTPVASNKFGVVG
jgi:hypothetical protein